jgi:hypothetical protein
MMFLADRGTDDWASTCSPSVCVHVGSCIPALPCFTTRRVGQRTANHSYGTAVAEGALGRICRKPLICTPISLYPLFRSITCER